LIAALSAAIACASEGKAETPKVTAEMLAKGQTTYMTVCAPCHGEQGKGNGPASKIFKPSPRDHTDAAYMTTLSDEDLSRIITIGGAVKGKPNMPGNPQLRGSELEGLVAYVRSLSRAH
jgi:mono/diheme cytochrome c family protein